MSLRCTAGSSRLPEALTVSATVPASKLQSLLHYRHLEGKTCSRPCLRKSIILDAMPYGTMGTPAFRFTVERGVDNTLTARRATYQQIAKQLRRFAAVFGDEETRVLAHEIVERYPNRTALREELAFAL